MTARPRYQAVDAVTRAARAYQAATGFWPTRCAINRALWECPREVRVSNIIKTPQLLTKDPRVQFESNLITCVHSAELGEETLAMTCGSHTWRLFNADKQTKDPA